MELADPVARAGHREQVEVINHLETLLPARVFVAEYAVLDGRRPRFRSFTKIESRVTDIFRALYAVALAIGVLLVANVI